MKTVGATLVSEGIHSRDVFRRTLAILPHVDPTPSAMKTDLGRLFAAAGGVSRVTPSHQRAAGLSACKTPTVLPAWPALLRSALTPALGLVVSSLSVKSRTTTQSAAALLVPSATPSHVAHRNRSLWNRHLRWTPATLHHVAPMQSAGSVQVKQSVLVSGITRGTHWLPANPNVCSIMIALVIRHVSAQNVSTPALEPVVSMPIAPSPTTTPSAPATRDTQETHSPSALPSPR